MKKITIENNEINLKKDFLTNGEVNYMVEEVLKIYQSQGNIDGYSYDPLGMITNFYALLFDATIEGYDIDNIDDYNKYYNIGTQYWLLKEVKNADEAYHLMMSLSKNLISVENIIDRNLNILVNAIINKIPDTKSLNKIVNKLPKEWQKVFDEYNDITGKDSTKEGE